MKTTIQEEILRLLKIVLENQQHIAEHLTGNRENCPIKYAKRER